jgi:hypothetical protein
MRNIIRRVKYSSRGIKQYDNNDTYKNFIIFTPIFIFTFLLIQISSNDNNRMLRNHKIRLNELTDELDELDKRNNP